MNKKRLQDLAGIQLNEKFTSPEELILALMNELERLADEWYNEDDDSFEEGLEAADVGDALHSVYTKFQDEPIVRRIFVGARRQKR